jgi:hypothetical protein
MKAILAIVLTIKVLMSSVVGQNNNFYQSGNELFSKVRQGQTLVYEQIEGSPYFNKEFLEGKLFLIDGAMYQIPLRYNIFESSMEYKRNDTVLFVADKKVKSSIIGLDTFIRSKFKIGNNIQNTYFQVMVNGNFKLLKRNQIQFCEREPNIGYNTPKPERFEKMADEYFLLSSDSVAQRFLNEKDFKKRFPELFEKIAPYIMEKKLKFTREKDLLLIFRKINGLR